MAGQIISKVAAGGGTHLVAPSAYFVCSTAAATQAKVAKCADTNVDAFVPVHGTTIAVRFVNSNTYNGTVTLTLQTNGGTQIFAAHNAYRYGTTNIGNNSTNSWQANSIVTFTYDTVINSNGYWIMNNWNNIDNNTYPSVYCSTAAGTAEKIGTLTNGALVTGYYTVNVTNANTSATAITLNINGKGAKPIWINGTASSTSNYSLPAGFYIIYYDGANNRFYFRTDGKIPCLITSDSLTTTSITPVTSKQVGVSVTNTAISTSQVSNGVLDLTGVLKNVVLNLGASVTTEDAINVVTGEVK